MNPSPHYVKPKNNQDVKEKNGTDAYGNPYAPLVIVDGITLFGANNASDSLADNNLLGIHWNDLKQGGIGDCYVLAAIRAIAHKQPETLRDLFTDNGDGTVSLSFFESIGESATEVTVSMTLDFGKLESYLSEDTDDFGDFEVWPIIFEKAYREFKANLDPPEPLAAGKAETVWEHIFATGHDRKSVSSLTDTELKTRVQNALTSGLITANTSGPSDLGPDKHLYGPHAYVVIGYDDNGTANVSDDTITLFNPHGRGTAAIPSFKVRPVLTFQELKDNVSSLSAPKT